MAILRDEQKLLESATVRRIVGSPRALHGALAPPPCPHSAESIRDRRFKLSASKPAWHRSTATTVWASSSGQRQTTSPWTSRAAWLRLGECATPTTSASPVTPVEGARNADSHWLRSRSNRSPNADPEKARALCAPRALLRKLLGKSLAPAAAESRSGCCDRACSLQALSRKRTDRLSYSRRDRTFAAQVFEKTYHDHFQIHHG